MQRGAHGGAAAGEGATQQDSAQRDVPASAGPGSLSAGYHTSSGNGLVGQTHSDGAAQQREKGGVEGGGVVGAHIKFFPRLRFPK